MIAAMEIIRFRLGAEGYKGSWEFVDFEGIRLEASD